MIRTWVLTRIVKEKFEVSGEDKETASDNAIDPFEVTIIKETMKLDKGLSHEEVKSYIKGE